MKEQSDFGMVLITVGDRSVSVPLHHFAPFMTSASLALNEWENKAIQKAKDALSVCAFENDPERLGSPENAIASARATLADYRQRRKSLEAIEALRA